MGMQLISFDDIFKHNCVAEFVKSIKKTLIFSLKFPYPTFAANEGVFANAENYLIAMSDQKREGSFEWCTCDAPANVSSLLTWDDSQPDNFQNSEHCGSMYVDPDLPAPGNILLSDISCDNDYFNYICDVSIRQKNIAELLLLDFFQSKPVACSTPKCPKLPCDVEVIILIPYLKLFIYPFNYQPANVLEAKNWKCTHENIKMFAFKHDFKFSDDWLFWQSVQ